VITVFVGIIYYEHICNSLGIEGKKNLSRNSCDCCLRARKKREEKQNSCGDNWSWNISCALEKSCI